MKFNWKENFKMLSNAPLRLSFKTESTNKTAHGPQLTTHMAKHKNRSYWNWNGAFQLDDKVTTAN